MHELDAAVDHEEGAKKSGNMPTQRWDILRRLDDAKM